MDSVMRRSLQSWTGTNSLGSLIALYEGNYQRLLQLLPEPDFPFDSAVSRSALDHDLHLRVLERSRYTATLHLSYRFIEEGVERVEPDLHVRVYRDAALAEALYCGPHAHCLALRDFDFGAESMLQSRRGRNLFLHKWLAFLLERGHGFSLAGRPRLAQPLAAACAQIPAP